MGAKGTPKWGLQDQTSPGLWVLDQHVSVKGRSFWFMFSKLLVTYSIIRHITFIKDTLKISL